MTSPRHARFDGLVALVTGGAGGIGVATAGRLVAESAAVALVDRRADEVVAAAKLLSDPGGDASAWPCDLADPDAITQVIDDVLARHGRLDVLVNNAGTGWRAPLRDHPAAAWDRVFAVNARAPFLLAREAAAALGASGCGAIVNVGSAAVRGLGGHVSYDASKGAVVALTKALAVELGADGIRVNAVCPGLIRTAMLDASTGTEERILPQVPLRRVGHPSEVAAAIAFLASKDARYITGQALFVDGGWIRS